jgi:hypothetical protein
MWRDATKTRAAAEALKISAPDLLELKLIDGIIPEPEGGAHIDHAAAAKLLDPFLSRTLDELSLLSAGPAHRAALSEISQHGAVFRLIPLPPVSAQSSHAGRTPKDSPSLTQRPGWSRPSELARVITV